MSEITNPKLLDLFAGITSAMEQLQQVATNPMKVVEIARTIERGEKVLSKEYMKRVIQLEELQAEISVIREFAAKMHYNLSKGDDTE